MLMQEHDGVLRNLSSLSPEDQEAFVELLKSGAPRFVVHRLSTAHPLLSKGILRSVQILDDLDWICEFHPAITNRAKLLPLAEGHRDGRPFGAGRHSVEGVRRQQGTRTLHIEQRPTRWCLRRRVGRRQRRSRR